MNKHISQNVDLYLASASPRRQELLSNMNLKVASYPADIDESINIDESPREYVKRLALEKARTSLSKIPERNPRVPCLGADTIVVCENEMFGKPIDKHHAFRMWQSMSDNQHQVLTAVAIISGECLVSTRESEPSKNQFSKEKVVLSSNIVKFKLLTHEEMQQYWLSGEPKDKAGAYGIQGMASAWVTSISGSYSGIMGLPLFETNTCLKEFGLNWL